MDEKRRFPRFEHAYEIKYSPLDKEGVFGFTVSKDVSRGGMGFPAHSGLAGIGSTLKLFINTNDNRGLISATGKVKWAKQITRPATLDEEVGVEFIEISPPALERLTAKSFA